MSLVSTSILNAFAVAMRMLAMLGLNKLLAVYIGPIGYAAMGHFQNAVTMITTLGSGAINTGVTKLTAEFHEEPAKQDALWRTASCITFACTLLTSLILLIFRQEFAVFFLQDASYASVFTWFSATLILFVFNTYLLAILNGMKAVGLYVCVNIATSLATVFITWLLARQWGLYGALIALASNQSLSCVLTIILCWRCPWFRWRRLFGGWDQVLAGKLGSYSLMAMVTAIAAPLSQILIRDHLRSHFGEFNAGLWQAVIRVSDMYLLVFTSTLTIYFLPRLAQISNTAQLKTEIKKVYRFILPLTAISAVIVYLLRDFVVRLLFTQDFLPMLDLMAWQLFGDVIKIGSWVLGFVLIGRAMTRAYIITEIIFSITIVLLTYILSPWLGLQAAIIAFVVNYILYWICIAVILKKYINN